MMKNPYTEPLELFSFDEMMQALDAISDETSRLDFKENISRPNLAHKACAFANADGGLIVIGITDPVPGRSLEFADPPSTDDKERLAIVSSINSRVYPALSVEVRGYRSASGTEAIMVVRAPRSNAAPARVHRQRSIDKLPGAQSDSGHMVGARAEVDAPRAGSAAWLYAAKFCHLVDREVRRVVAC